MSTVGLCSAKGSPGVTTAALALMQVWPLARPGRRVLLVDADPAGGDVASGFLRGEVDPARGVLGLAAGHAPDPAAAVGEQLLAVDPDGDRLLLLGAPDARRADAVGAAWSVVAAALPELMAGDPAVDVLVDLGRLGAAHEAGALRRALGLVVLVTGSSLRAVVAGRAAAGQLREQAGAGQRVGLVVVGPGRPYAAREVSAAVGLPLLGELPHDPAAAAVFSDGVGMSRRTARSVLLRAAHALAGDAEPAPGDSATAPAPPPAGPSGRVVGLFGLGVGHG